VRPDIIISLSSVLFKSYLRAGRTGRVSSYSQPRIILILDLLAFAAPIVLLQNVMQSIPVELMDMLEPIVRQAFVGLPILLTSGIILAGILFELGQSAGLSSSEAVNFLPVSPREYVAASATSLFSVYSPLLAISAGISLPLAQRFGLMSAWPLAVALSALALLQGAFIVEILRSGVNRFSSTVYKRRGRFGVVSRLVLLIILFTLIQLAFSPYILYYTLGAIVSGVEFAWFVPVIWSSVAMLDQIGLDLLSTILFSALSLVFTYLMFETASWLRTMFWSPAPMSIMINTSVVYTPAVTARPRFGFGSLELAIALKELRSLVRRKDMARFLAVPIMIVIVYILPVIVSSQGVSYSGSSPGFFLAVFVPFIVTLMLSTIAVGQEGKAVINLYMLPISAKAFIKGKLLLNWIISGITTIGIVGIFEVIAPMGYANVAATLLAGTFVIFAESFIGLGIGSRHPDFTVGSRSRYVTLGGFLLGFLAGGTIALVIFAPIALHLILSGGIRGSTPILGFGLGTMIPITIAIGSILTYITYRYCKMGVEEFLSNLKA